MKFIKRTTAPSADNKYYLKAGKGGYNRAMEINSKTHSCLSNCVAMAHGRWLECRGLTDYNTYDKLPTGNAENYYGYTKDGYKRGLEPKVGAIICWRKGQAGNASDGAGHVAFVEEVKPNGDVVTSNSAYNGSRYYLKTYTKASNYYMGSKYTFQGFIYNPENFEEVVVKHTYTGEFPKIPCVAIKDKKGKITSYRRYFAKGDKGAEVKKLQSLLNWLNGSKLKVDGVIGLLTIAEVKKFQKKVGITQDGKFGNGTLTKAKTFKK